MNVNAAPFRDRATRGGPGVLGNPSRSVWYYFNTDNRRALSFFYNGYYECDGPVRHVRHGISPGVNLRPSSAVSVNAGIRYDINHDDAQWVTNESDAAGATHYVFGRIDQRRWRSRSRFNYTMTPTLSLQIYAEPFVSAGDYSNFRELVDGRAQDYAARYAPYAYAGSADFNYRSFRTTNVLRWEYKPGSALFVVWQQNRSDDADVRRLQLRPRLRRHLQRPGAQRVPGEVQLLAQYVACREPGVGSRESRETGARRARSSRSVVCALFRLPAPDSRLPVMIPP